MILITGEDTRLAQMPSGYFLDIMSTRPTNSASARARFKQLRAEGNSETADAGSGNGYAAGIEAPAVDLRCCRIPTPAAPAASSAIAIVEGSGSVVVEPKAPAAIAPPESS